MADTTQTRQDLIAALGAFPQALAALVEPLTPVQLTTPFVAGEWTVAQNVHHLADSHMNSYVRCKLILTEDYPTLKPYDQDHWANLPDAQTADIGPSLQLLRGLHQRWAAWFAALGPEDWGRKGLHPENGDVDLAGLLAAYVAHGEAHLAQIRATLAAA